MAGSHRKPTRRERRAHERRTARLTIKARKAAISAGVVLAAASVALGPSLAHAEQIATVANAQNDAATWSNLLIVADAAGKTQGAILAPLGSIAPDGTLPQRTNTRTTPTTESLTFIEGIGSVLSAAIDTPDTSHVPGSGGAYGVGGIAAGLPQYLSVVPLALATADVATTIAPKSATTIAALLGVDATTVTKNTLADGTGLLGDKVTQHADYITDKLDLTNTVALQALLGLPDVTHTTETWNNTYTWPLLQANGKTWMIQESYVVDPVTSRELKDKYKDQIGDLDTLRVQKGKTTRPITGYEEQAVKDASNCAYEFVSVGPLCGVTKYTTVLGKKIPIGFDNKPWGSKTELLPVYGPLQFVPDLGENGNPIYETTYDPNPGVDNALKNLDGVDTTGFSLTKREAGGAYTFLGDGSLGWLTSTTQLIVGDQVTTIPVYAAGGALPFGLLTAGGQYTPGIVTQSGQATSASMGSRSQGISIPALGLGVNTTSLLESFQAGPAGIAYNSGWTIAALDIPGIDFPIPVVFSAGSFNFGPQGVGFTGPSLFGVGLPGFQLGENIAAAGSTDDSVLSSLTALTGQLPTSLIVLDPKLLFQLANIDDPTGLGLTDPLSTVQKLLNPLYTKGVTPGATKVSQALADLATKAGNDASAGEVKASGQLADVSVKVAENTGKVSDGVSDGLSDIAAKYPTTVQQKSNDEIIESNRLILTDSGDSASSSAGNTGTDTGADDSSAGSSAGSGDGSTAQVE